MRKFWGSLIACLILSAGIAAPRPAPSVETAGAVADESIQLQTQTGGTVLYFPDYVDGGGWSVQLALGNLDPNRNARVEVEVYDQQGQPVRGLFDSGTRPSSNFSSRYPTVFFRAVLTRISHQKDR